MNRRPAASPLYFSGCLGCSRASPGLMFPAMGVVSSLRRPFCRAGARVSAAENACCAGVSRPSRFLVRQRRVARDFPRRRALAAAKNQSAALSWLLNHSLGLESCSFRLLTINSCSRESYTRLSSVLARSTLQIRPALSAACSDFSCGTFFGRWSFLALCTSPLEPWYRIQA